MATVRELVTKLSFKLDNSGLAEYSKNMSALQQRAKSIQNSFQSSSLGQGIKAIRDKFKATDEPLETAKKKSVNERVKELTSYKDELKDLSASERRDILDLNRIEKQALREVAQEQKRVAAEKKQQDQEERRRIAQLARDRRRINFLEGMGKVTRFANRALTGIIGTATASFGFSYKDFKDYQKNKAAGKTAKTSLNSDQIRQFENFDKVAKTFKENISSLRNAFSVALLPAITAVLKPFNEWYKLNRKIIDGKLKDFALQLGSAFKTIGNAFAKVLPAINSIVNLFGGLENVILALIGVKIGGWLVGLATFLASPLGAVAALSAAFYLLYDEIKTTMEGGESYLKDFYESSYIKFISNQVEDVVKVFKEWYDALNNIFNLTDKFSSIKSLFSNIATDIGDGIKGALSDLTVYVDNKNKARDSSLGLVRTSNLASSDFMQKMAVTNKSQNVVNNINGGGIKISINSTGNIDDNAVKKLAKQLNEEFDQKLSDIFTLAMPTIIN